MLKYEAANWGDIAAEIAPLTRRHWEEVALDKEMVPLDIDYLRYSQIEAAGMLVIITARDPARDNRLVGYISAVCTFHLHYERTMFGVIDVYWLEPRYRQGLNGILLFTKLEEELKRRGVVKMIGQTKIRRDLDVSIMFEALGWKRAELIFTKVI